MKKIRLFIIDSDEIYRKTLKEYFSYKEIEVSLESSNGEESILLLETKKDQYDIVLLDIILSKKDGLKVLEYIQDNNYNKKVFVITSYYSQDIIRKVASLGASYFLLKPINIKDLEEKILEIKKDEEKGSINLYQNHLDKTITTLLHELGVPSHIKGYQYIKEGIKILYKDIKENNIYERIAESFSTSISKIERNIRHAIEISWNRGNWDLMIEIFGNSIDIEKGKPTNIEYMITITERIKLEYHKPLNTK